MAEFDEYLQKCKYVNAPLKWAREQWNSYVKFLSKRIDGFASYQKKVNYAVGSEESVGINQCVLVGTTENASYGGTPIFSSTADIQNTLAAAFVADSPYSFFGAAARQKNISSVKNVRGLLTAVTVREFVAALGNFDGISEIISDYYSASRSFTINTKIEIDPDTSLPISVMNDFGDWIVPTIKWYYDDVAVVDGEPITTVKDDIPIFIPCFFTQTRAIERKWYEAQSISGHTRLVPKQDMIGTSPLLYPISPPFVDGKTGSEYRQFNFITRKYVTAKWGATPNDYVVNMFSTPNARVIPYVPLFAVDTTRAARGVIEIANAMNNVGIPTGRSEPFSAYKNVQSVIDFFADFGVHLYTDITDIYSQPDGDREQDNEINPDNPDDPLPAFPDNTSDVIPIERAYITASSFGNSNVYTPTTTKSFLNWVCDSSVSIDNWKRLFANPADVITGILIYNLDIVQHDSALTRLNSETNILGVTTPIANYSIINGYNNIIDGGTINLQAYYGNYSDFTNMTYQLFAPFVGFVSLRACDVVNKTLSLKYAVDFATGSAVAFVTSDSKLIYSAPCSVCGKIPLSISDRNQQILNNTFSALNSIGGIVGGIASGNVGGAVSAALGGKYQFQTNYAARGSMTSVNMFSLFPAFIERTRYDLFLPSGEKTYVGAAYQTAAGAPTTDFTTVINAADVGGYVECEFVQISSAAATEEEKAQIIALLKSGIYI